MHAPLGATTHAPPEQPRMPLPCEQNDKLVLKYYLAPNIRLWAIKMLRNSLNNPGILSFQEGWNPVFIISIFQYLLFALLCFTFTIFLFAFISGWTVTDSGGINCTTFNSRSFNLGRGVYHTRQYYTNLREASRTAFGVEQHLLKEFLSAWKEAGQPLGNWTFNCNNAAPEVR